MKEKEIWLIRHPSSLWTPGLLRRAEVDGKDVETYVPPSKDGIKMSLDLAEYLAKQDLAGAEIYASPIFRAGILANIVLAYLAAEDEPGFPDDVVPCPHLTEITWKDSAEAAEEIYERSQRAGIHFLRIEFREDPEGNVARYKQHLDSVVRPALNFLGKLSCDLAFAFSHSGTIGEILWVIDQLEKGRDVQEVTVKDLPEIAKFVTNIGHTSISKIVLMDEGWYIKSVGEIPHLKKIAPRDKLW